MQFNNMRNKTKNHRQLFIDLVKRAAAILTAAAIFVGPSNVTFATTPSHERQSEHALERLLERHLLASSARGGRT